MDIDHSQDLWFRSSARFVFDTQSEHSLRRDGKVGFLHQICISVNGAGLLLPRFLNAAPLCFSSGGSWKKYTDFRWMNWDVGVMARLHVQRWCGQPCKLHCTCRFYTRSSQFNCFELFLGRLHQEEYELPENLTTQLPAVITDDIFLYLYLN